LIRIRSENLSLTLCTISRKKLPSPPWEGIKGRGDQTGAEYFLSTPTLTLPHQGGGDYSGNFKYFWLKLNKEEVK
jgi:hypothetical protein